MSTITVSQLAQCYGKDILSWDHAVKVAKRKRRRTHKVYVPYPCQHCNGVHVGQKDRWKR